MQPSGEFRRTLLGGFKQDDVLNYLDTLALETTERQRGLQKSINELRADNLAKAKELAELRRMSEQYRQQFQEFDQEKAMLAQGKIQLHAEREAFAAERGALQEQIDRLTQQQQMMLEEREGLSSEIAAERENISVQVAAERDRMLREMRESAGALPPAEGAEGEEPGGEQATRVEAELIRTQWQLETATAQESEYQKEIAEYRRMLTECEELINGQHEQIQQLTEMQQQYKENTVEIGQLIMEAKNAADRINKEAQDAAYRTEREALAKTRGTVERLASAQSAIVRLKNEAAQATLEFTETMGRLSEEIETYKHQVDAHTAELDRAISGKDKDDRPRVLNLRVANHDN